MLKPLTHEADEVEDTGIFGSGAYSEQVARNARFCQTVRNLTESPAIAEGFPGLYMIAPSSSSKSIAAKSGYKLQKADLFL